MPSRTRSLTLPQARDLIRERAFAERTGERVGLELEWLTSTPNGHGPTVAELRGLVAEVDPLPAGSRISFEPGGQLEISTAAHGSCSEAIEAACADAAVVRQSLHEHGIETTAVGMDPARSRALRTDEPR
ncbi:MAG: glutamate-cysteine ligase family protein [Candidatus Binatia bacterium]